MSVMTTAAILGLGALSAGTGVAGSLIQGHQASKAVDAQQKATAQALALQQQQQQQAQQNMSPYMQAGQMTLGRLGDMAAQPAAQFNPANFSGGVPTGGGQPALKPQGSGPMGPPPPPQWPGGTPMPSQQLPGQAPLGAPPGAPLPGQQPGGQGPTVTIQTADGRTLQGFPRERLPEAMQQGARVV